MRRDTPLRCTPLLLAPPRPIGAAADTVSRAHAGEHVYICIRDAAEIETRRSTPGTSDTRGQRTRCASACIVNYAINYHLITGVSSAADCFAAAASPDRVVIPRDPLSAIFIRRATIKRRREKE